MERCPILKTQITFEMIIHSPVADSSRDKPLKYKSLAVTYKDCRNYILIAIG